MNNFLNNCIFHFVKNYLTALIMYIFKIDWRRVIKNFNWYLLIDMKILTT